MYLLFFVNQNPFSIDKNQQNEYTELPTIAVIGLAGCCMLQALAYSWQEVFLDVISSEYIYICNKAAAAAAVKQKERRRRGAAARRATAASDGWVGARGARGAKGKRGKARAAFFPILHCSARLLVGSSTN